MQISASLKALVDRFTVSAAGGERSAPMRRRA